MEEMQIRNELLSAAKLEQSIYIGFVLGAAFLILNAIFGGSVRQHGSDVAKAVFVELQRKSFHMIGGCIICAAYHYGIKFRYLSSAYLPDSSKLAVASSSDSEIMDGGAAFLSVCFATWGLEAARLQVPSVQNWYLKSTAGLIREKEQGKAAGVAYFLPGSLAAMLAGPSNLAILGILYLSIGDAAASIGTAAGCIPVGHSKRKLEGTVGCFVVCTLLGLHAGLVLHVALVAAAFVATGEVLAEVIGLDDNLVLPMLGVLGIRIALHPQLFKMIGVMAVGLAIGLGLAVLVATAGSTSSTAKVGKDLKE
eukprot:TRINITY_DN50196_c0_g1_i1.p1 TRINITY_DN50196_c0_g1~~TRINITY_DN50196_c0_g1_i1.p1  ORF type:complete len:309 (+),score=43.45 TRINITY_DN50196_c0_g1_i1:127-1053(+)